MSDRRGAADASAVVKKGSERWKPSNTGASVEATREPSNRLFVRQGRLPDATRYPEIWLR